MTEPITSMAMILSKLIGLGIASYKAVRTEGLTQEDLTALKMLLEEAKSLSGKKSKDEVTVAAVQLALIARAFGAAVGRHWAFNEAMVPAQSRVPTWIRKLWDRSPERADEIEVRLRLADLRPVSFGDGHDPIEELEALHQLTSGPSNSPYYRALWRAFSNPKLNEENVEPLLSLAKDEDGREFERFFRQAYIELLASADGRRVIAWTLELAKERAHALRWALMVDMAGWDHRHVFGGAVTSQSDDVVPFMPLGGIYVEPDARRSPDIERRPILSMLTDLMPKHQLLVVKADFGHGKSLTARTLAKNLAQAWRSQNQAVGTQVALPIFIKCSRDIREPTYAHAAVVRRALWNHAKEELGLNLPMEDQAFNPPGQDQEVLFILDGLDEISFVRSQLESLFQCLDECARGSHRAIVFTRPGALGSHDPLPRDTPVIDLCAFGTSQIKDWIGKWNALPGQQRPTDLEGISKQGLFEMARTPILLFMIALTGVSTTDKAGKGQREELYERFFRVIAKGKLDQDERDGHPTIHQASEKLLSRLQEANGVLDAGSDKIDAMLWLMSRVAWASHERAQRSPPSELRVSDLEVSILDGELKLPSEVRATVQLGLVLALQIDPAKGDQGDILFGHKSFREFLVARYWRWALRRLAKRDLSRAERQKLENALMAAFLQQRGDAAFEMLSVMLNDLPQPEQSDIHNWAHHILNNEDLSAVSLRADRRSVLRLSALSVGSAIAAMRLDDADVLRSLFAWFFVHDVDPIVYARGLQAPRANLSGAKLLDADLADANLTGADLRDAHLVGAVLDRADLTDADCHGAVLVGVGLDDAKMRGVNLFRANLSGARMRKADLTDVNLVDANFGDRIFASYSRHTVQIWEFPGAVLAGATLTRATIRRSQLDDLIVEEADLADAEIVDDAGEKNTTNLLSAVVPNRFRAASRKLSPGES